MAWLEVAKAMLLKTAAAMANILKLITVGPSSSPLGGWGAAGDETSGNAHSSRKVPTKEPLGMRCEMEGERRLLKGGEFNYAPGKSDSTAVGPLLRGAPFVAGAARGDMLIGAGV